MKKAIFVAGAIACFAGPTTVAAQSLDPDEEVTVLDRLIISGGLTPISADAYGRSSTVITAQQIEDRGIKTVQDALRAVPGVSVNGSGSNFTQVRIRGGEANHTLVLIDGVRLEGGDGAFGYNFSGLEATNIERIEVLRGAQSVFYGSNASSGVVNIITRKGKIGTEISGSFEGGGGDTFTGFASVRTEQGGIAVGYTDARDDGWDFSGSNGEKDNTDRRTFNANGDLMITPDFKVGFTYRDSEENYSNDTTNSTATRFQDYVVDLSTEGSEREEMTASFFAELSTLDDRLKHRFSWETTSNSQLFISGIFGNFFAGESTTDSFKYLASLSLDGRSVGDANQILNIMIETEEDASSSNVAFNRKSDSVAAEYRGTFDNGFSIQGGLRQDYNNKFENYLSWNVGVAYEFENGVRLHSSAGTGIINPTFSDLTDRFFPGFLGSPNTSITGDPNLQPEENESFDFGIEVPIFDGRGFVDVTYFKDILTNEIESAFISFDAGTNTDNFLIRNQAGESTREGVEVTSQLAVTDYFDFRTSYTYIDARDPNGTAETRRPRHEASVGATLRAFEDRATFTADLRYVAGLYDREFFGARRLLEMPSFATVDLAANYELNENLTLTARAVNIFDDQAMEVWGYNGRPRTFYVGIKGKL